MVKMRILSLTKITKNLRNSYARGEILDLSQGFRPFRRFLPTLRDLARLLHPPAAGPGRGPTSTATKTSSSATSWRATKPSK